MAFFLPWYIYFVLMLNLTISNKYLKGNFKILLRCLIINMYEEVLRSICKYAQTFVSVCFSACICTSVHTYSWVHTHNHYDVHFFFYFLLFLSYYISCFCIFVVAFFQTPATPVQFPAWFTKNIQFCKQWWAKLFPLNTVLEIFWK